MKLSPPSLEDYYHDEFGNKLSRSSFNLSWCEELGITPKVVFDIGSCDLGDALRFKQKFGCETYSFEASPERFKICEKIAKDHNLKVYNYAVYKQDGEIDFYQSFDNNQKTPGAQGSIYQHSQEYKNNYRHIQQLDKIVVDTIKLSTFCERENISEIDVVHIDVEGGEYDVLLGLNELRPKIIFVEILSHKFWVDSPDRKFISIAMKRLGYKLVLKTWSDELYVYNENRTG